MAIIRHGIIGTRDGRSGQGRRSGCSFLLSHIIYFLGFWEFWLLYGFVVFIYMVLVYSYWLDQHVDLTICLRLYVLCEVHRVSP